MAIICARYHSTRNWSYHAQTRCFTAEASDFGPAGAVFDARVYDDACDVGFILVSHKTGDSILFVQDGTDMNGDDVAGWRYKAYKFSNDLQAPGGWSNMPAHLDGITALVIND